MRVLVTGVRGQLGFDCVKELRSRNFKDVIGIDIDDLDITNKKAVNDYLTRTNPDVIIHCAAFTAVDRAETEKQLAYSVNVLGTKYIAQVAQKIGSKLVYISTDYVFPGTGARYYEVTDNTGPTNYYGHTKLEGEQAASLCSKLFIIRISWVFGINGNNFIKSMIDLANKIDKLTVVDDQIGSPTYTVDLAKLICDMINTDKYGVYHATNEGVCSWYEFAKEIFRLTNQSVHVLPTTSKEYQSKVTSSVNRPLNSRLSKKSLDNAGFTRLPDWKNALERFVQELKESKFI